MNKFLIGSAAALLWVAGMLSSAQAQTFVRIESRPFVSTTLTQDQVLNGEKTGTPATISGILRIPGPPSDTSKLPVVLFLPGLGGINIAHDDWTAEIDGMGAITFIVDSFTGRGLLLLPEHARLPALARLADAYAALEVLSKHPRVDISRVAIMGLSHGATAALYSSNERFRKQFSSGDLTFAAHVGLYGHCNTVYRDDTKTTGKPIRMYHGIADDWIPIEPCRQYVDRLKQAKQDVALSEMPDALHAYDNRYFKHLKFPNVNNINNCRWEEKENGKIVNAKTGVPIASDTCYEKGTQMGYNEAAHKRTVTEVKAFVTETIGLKK